MTDLDQQTIAGRIKVILVKPETLPDDPLKKCIYNISLEILKTQTESVFGYWNEGLKNSHTPFVSVIHPADRYRSDAFERILAVFERDKDADLVYSDVLSTTQADETFRAHSARNAIRFPDYDRPTLLRRGFTEIRPVWRKSLHDKYSFLDEGLLHTADLEFWLRVSDESVFRRIPEFLTLRYDGSDAGDARYGISNADRRKEFAGLLPYYENDYLRNNGPVSEKIARLRKIEELLSRNQQKTGFGKLEEALKMDPQDQELWICKIRRLMEVKDFKQAKETLNQALKIFPKDVRLINYRAIHLWRDGYKRQAQTMLEKVIRENPLELEIRVTLSEMYRDTGDISRAIQQILFLINQVHNNLSLYATLITHLLGQGDVLRA
ncbi:MAG TPA: hypothetical protein VKA08_05140, partial [Balneolales bacterium]|nr:hypothetical protein [Balneolales bacterium]